MPRWTVKLADRGEFGTLPDAGWCRRRPYHDRLRCFLAARQRRLDRAQLRTGIERLARKEYGLTVRYCQHRLRFACSWRGVRIRAARERIVAPVDRSRRDEIPSDAVERQIENLAERGEPYVDEFSLGK